MAVEVDDLAFFLPGFQTGRTEVLASQLHVAQGAQESSAMIARDDSFFLGMIETARLIIDRCLPYFSGLNTTRKGWKYIDS
jgi:hypothetical protein